MSLRLIGVVVPARDEEELLPACLSALEAARRHRGFVGVPTEVVVVANGCTDATAAVGRRAGVTVLDRPARTVGEARHRGMRHVIDDGGRAGLRPEQIWLACTDADSQVPPDWLAGQVAAARSGVDAVLGTVAVADWSGTPAQVAAEFTRRYEAWRGTSSSHPHVHGANFGVRASAYLAAGGFPPLAVGEDVALAVGLRAAGATVLRTTAHPVTTSARRAPRAPGGFGTDLQLLAASG